MSRKQFTNWLIVGLLCCRFYHSFRVLSSCYWSYSILLACCLCRLSVPVQLCRLSSLSLCFISLSLSLPLSHSLSISISISLSLSLSLSISPSFFLLTHLARFIWNYWKERERDNLLQNSIQKFSKAWEDIFNAVESSNKSGITLKTSHLYSIIT